MISTHNVSLSYGGRVLFDHVEVKFLPGYCYGLIGANGTGKSTFLKVLSGELEPSKGEVFITPGQRLSVLAQDHFAFDGYTVMQTVLMGYQKLYDIMKEKDALYEKTDFTEEEGMRLSILEGEFAELDGWSAESDAEILLGGLGIGADMLDKSMAELTGNQKVKVLLAQALFGNPDILLLDEPTNHLDHASIRWLEDFLMDFPNTVIIVSHDRHFLNTVCTHIADIDFSRVQLYAGNYDFWYEYTQMMTRQQKEQNKRAEAKVKELQEFIQRFSANASKSKQATSRKKILDNMVIEEFRPSSRRYPFVQWKPEREVGNDILWVKNISKTVGERKVLNNVSFMINKEDKIALVGEDEVAKTTLMQICMGELEPDEGEIVWGVTTSRAYLPKDNNAYFDGVNYNLVDWLRQYSEDQHEITIRGWLGRMLFSGEEVYKEAKVLSGGEKVRCMLCKSMISGANVLLLDEPTNHLDLEAITALNDGMVQFKGNMLFTSHDHQLVLTVANRLIEILPGGIIDRRDSYDDYLDNLDIIAQRRVLMGE